MPSSDDNELNESAGSRALSFEDYVKESNGDVVNAFEGIVYPSYFKEIWGQTENDHLLPSLIHFWNAIALTAALVLTMVFEPKNVWEDAYIPAEETIWGVESQTPQNYWNIFNAITFNSALGLLFFTVFGIVYASLVPESAGEKFIENIGLLWYSIFPSISIILLVLSLIASVTVRFSCNMTTATFLAQAIYLFIVALFIMWFVINSAPKAAKRSIQYNNLKIKYYDQDGDLKVSKQEVSKVEKHRRATSASSETTYGFNG